MELSLDGVWMGGAASVQEPCDLPEATRNGVLDGGPSAEAVARLLRDGVEGRKARVLVAAGAGLSVAAGIPDFRTPGTGLYDNLEKYGLPTPESVFTLEYFKEHPQAFCDLAKDLLPGSYPPTIGHCFLRLLEEKGMLLRLFTQNIDGLERLSGISPELLVEAHGSFADAHCVECHQQHSIHTWRRCIEETRELPRCGATRVVEAPKAPPAADVLEEMRHELETLPARREAAWKSTDWNELTNIGMREARLKGDLERGEKEVADWPQQQAEWEAGPKTFECTGLVKPDIVFFGEGLPSRFSYLSDRDGQQADLLLVLGTSLKVMPFAGILGKVSALCPRLLINREAVGKYQQDEPPIFFGNIGFRFDEPDNYRDVHVANDCDAGCLSLAKLVGWAEELQDMAKELQHPHPEGFDLIVASQRLQATFSTNLRASAVASELLEIIQNLSVDLDEKLSKAEIFNKKLGLAREKLHSWKEYLLVDVSVNNDDSAKDLQEKFMTSASTAYDALGETAFLAISSRQLWCLRHFDQIPGSLSQAFLDLSDSTLMSQFSILASESRAKLWDALWADRPAKQRPDDKAANAAVDTLKELKVATRPGRSSSRGSRGSRGSSRGGSKK